MISPVFSYSISKIGDSKVTLGRVPPPIKLLPFSIVVEKEIDLARDRHYELKNIELKVGIKSYNWNLNIALVAT